MSWKDSLGDDGKREVEQLEAAITERDQKLSRAGQELAENRSKKSEIEAERDALKVKLAEAEAKAAAGGGQTPDVDAAVARALAARDQESAIVNRATAEAQFKNAHKEFADDADAGGVKFSAVKSKLARFDLSSLKSVSDFMSAFEEAYTLVNPARAATGGGTFAPFAETPNNGGSPREVEKDKLDSKEQRLITRMGWTADQYLAQKAKRPSYLKNLLEHMD